MYILFMYTVTVLVISLLHKVHRVAMATFREHSIMRVKSAQAGEVGDCSPTPFPSTYKVVVYASAERADTLPLFLLYPYMYYVVYSIKQLYKSLRRKSLVIN